MFIKSIYEDHYRGMTYKVGVAYLRTRTETDTRAPAWAGRESLKKQRRMIALAAKRDKTIIVAEFVDTAEFAHVNPLVGELGAFCLMAGVPTCYVVNRSYFGEDPENWEWAFELSRTKRIDIREVEL